MAKTRLTKKLRKKENDSEEDIKDQPEEDKKSKRSRAQKKKATSIQKEKEEPEENISELLKPELAAEEKNEENQMEEEYMDINSPNVLKEEDKEEEVAEKKKNVKKHFVFKKDVNVKKVITLRRMNGGLYAYVEYTEKNKKKQKELQYGFIDTKEFVKSEPQILLQFYESVLEIEP